MNYNSNNYIPRHNYNNFGSPHNQAQSSVNSQNCQNNINNQNNADTNSQNNMNDFLSNITNMMNSGQIPDSIKNVLGNMMQNNPDENTGNDSNNFNNIDMNTIFKIQNIMNSINNDKQNESRTNLLLSLKPYLKESRKSKVDQYIQLMKMEKIFEAMNPLDRNLGGEKRNGSN